MKPYSSSNYGFQIDGVHEPDRLERYSHIQQRVTVMLHECGIEDPLIK